MTLRKLPIGIQDFPSIREEGYLYVDKTSLVYKIVSEGRVYFLSRPRRFGKSLLCSTLGAYFEGRKELFEGLAIAELEKDWKVHPVLRFDMNAKDYTQGHDALLLHLNKRLDENAAKYGIDLAPSTPDERLIALIQALESKTGMRVAVIVDEYDKPLLSVLDQPELQETYKATLKAFYGVLKSADAWLKFAFLTGVTKFGQVSVFSDLNQLQDLSAHPAFATLCGITEEELVRDFAPELKTLGEKQGMPPDVCLAEVRKMYNGYRFEENAVGVYNPFSTLNLFSTYKFSDYWFQTGTPTFLVELLKKTDTDLREIDGIEMDMASFSDYRQDPDRPLPVIYQSGYLTIKGYDPMLKRYRLGFPNDEVRNGFLNFCLPYYATELRGRAGFHVGEFTIDLRKGDVDGFMQRLQGFFEGIPYDLNDKTERHYHVVFYLVFTLMGQFIQTEHKTARGRADAVVYTQDKVFVFEFKLNGSAEEALAQIDSQGYGVAFAAQGREVVKVGVEFDKNARNIGRWLVG